MSTFRFALLLGAISAAIGISFGLYQSSPDQAETAVQAAPAKIQLRDQLAAFSYPDLEQNMRHSSEWQGKIIVLNFWASWCPPCRREMPGFVKLQSRYANDVQFIGLAIDEAQPVRDFTEQFEINFPILLDDSSGMKLSQTYGNLSSGLPYTAVFDRAGKLRFTRTGELNRETLDQEIQNLLN